MYFDSEIRNSKCEIDESTMTEKKLISSVLRDSVRKLRKVLHAHRLNVWLLEGEERWTGERLSFVYAGHKANRNHILHLAFNGSYRKSACGKAWVWDALKFGVNKYAGHPMVIMEIAKCFYRRFGRQEGFYIPWWVYGEIDLAVASMRIKQSSTFKADLRRIRKNHFQYEVTRDKDQFDHFYHSMYVPYITRAHGDRALLRSYDQLRHYFSCGELLFVKNKSKYVGCSLLVFEDDSVYAKELGIKDGNMHYLRAGVVSALYYYMILYLMEKGYKKVNVGASRAFLKDGVLVFKKRRGMRLSHQNPWPMGFLIKPLRKTDGVKAFLKNNPFIYVNNDSFNGAVFVESGEAVSEDQLKKLHKDHYVPGVAKLNIYQLGERQDPIAITTEEKLQFCVK